jgi:replicative superfamily II helicase
VVIKGTEFYDAKVKRYVDFPITDILQMMGRAGRPQFDTEARACILVQESKKTFYRCASPFRQKMHRDWQFFLNKIFFFHTKKKTKNK